MNRVPRKYLENFSLRSPLVTIFTLLLAAPAFAQQGNSPWENAVNVLMTAFTSTIARGLSLVAIVVSGLTFAFEPSRPILPTRLASSCTSREDPVAAMFLKSWRSTDMTPTRTSSTTGRSLFRDSADRPGRHGSGHCGYCTYDFFDQCPHRMACARCGFYRPKNSAAALFLEGKKNLLRLQQDMPLTEAEANAVEDGVNAFEKLLAQATEVPTPAGPIPRQLQSGLVQIEPTKERRE